MTCDARHTEYARQKDRTLCRDVRRALHPTRVANLRSWLRSCASVLLALTFATMAPLNLQELGVGARVQHPLLVFDRAEKTTGAGDPFVILTLGNSSGKLDTAPIWSDKIQWAEGASAGQIVQAIGHIALYGKNGTAKRQLQLTAPVRPLPRDQSRVEEFLPNTAGHHAKLGGLLLHTFEVAHFARTAARTTRGANPDLVFAGALLHDIGKVDSYEIGPGGFTYTPCGLIVGHIVLGVLMLERRLATLREKVCTDGQLLDLQHMILSHHGKPEYGSPVEPATVEAEILHWADEASAKANDMSEALEDPDGFLDGGEVSSKRIWRVGRRVWRRPHDWD